MAKGLFYGCGCGVVFPSIIAFISGLWLGWREFHRVKDFVQRNQLKIFDRPFAQAPSGPRDRRNECVVNERPGRLRGLVQKCPRTVVAHLGKGQPQHQVPLSTAQYINHDVRARPTSRRMLLYLVRKSQKNNQRNQISNVNEEEELCSSCSPG